MTRLSGPARGGGWAGRRSDLAALAQMWDEGEEGPFQDTEFADMPKKQQKAAKVLGAHPGRQWPRPLQAAD